MSHILRDFFNHDTVDSCEVHGRVLPRRVSFADDNKMDWMNLIEIQDDSQEMKIDNFEQSLQNECWG